jgi:hypothetical protein
MTNRSTRDQLLEDVAKDVVALADDPAYATALELHRLAARAQAALGLSTEPEPETSAEPSAVQNTIREMLRTMGRPVLDPRHVEAYMRLDGDVSKLSKPAFLASFREAVDRCDADNPASCEAMAKAAGL